MTFITATSPYTFWIDSSSVSSAQDFRWTNDDSTFIDPVYMPFTGYISLITLQCEEIYSCWDVQILSATQGIDGFGTFSVDQSYRFGLAGKTITGVDTGDEELIVPSHELSVDDKFKLNSNGGTLPGGLSDNGTYFVKSVVSSDRITISTTQGGSTLNLSGSVSGSPVLERNGGKFIFTYTPDPDDHEYEQGKGIRVRFNPITNSTANDPIVKIIFEGDGLAL